MNKTLLSIFIKNLNVDSSLRYLSYFGYNFTRQEIEIVLPYLKDNVNKLDKEHKEEIMKNLPKVSALCKSKLSSLFDQFI